MKAYAHNMHPYDVPIEVALALLGSQMRISLLSRGLASGQLRRAVQIILIGGLVMNRDVSDTLHIVYTSPDSECAFLMIRTNDIRVEQTS